MKKRLIPFAAVAVIMASCSSEDVLEVNPEPAGQPLSFSIAVGHTRATETTILNLGDFNVAAKGVHPSGGVFNNFLIGSANDGELASKDNTTSGVWKLGRDVYWPTSVDDALFWAWTCSQVESGTPSAVLPSGTTFEFSSTSPSLQVKDFSPAKADLSGAADASGMWADGLKQVDFVTAFAQARKTANVPLKFGHVLSQIDIVAASEEKAKDDHRIVRIKGAWLVNTKDKANLVSGFDWDTDNKKAEHALDWEEYGFKEGGFSAYGSFYKEPIVLDGKSSVNLLGGARGESRTLMLIPQSITGWDLKPINDTNENKEQAYILLLCRVELEHAGKTHTGTDLQDADVAIHGENHYHQQFPVNDTKQFAENEYGFVCVPVTADFKMGMRYRFKLDICGGSSGAGNYPPEADFIDFKELLPKDLTFTTNWDTNTTLTIVGRPQKDPNDPDYKVVGSPVLNDPIKFKVEFTDWSTDWTEGEVDL